MYIIIFIQSISKRMASGCETIRGRIDAVIGQASAQLRPNIIKQRLFKSNVEQPSKCLILSTWQEKTIILKRKRLYRFLSAFTNGQDCEELKEVIEFLLQYNETMRSLDVDYESDSNDEEAKDEDVTKKSNNSLTQAVDERKNPKNKIHRSVGKNSSLLKNERIVEGKKRKTPKRKVPIITTLSKEELLSKASVDAYRSLCLYEHLQPYFNEVDRQFHEILHKATSYLMMECSLIKIPSEFNIITRRVVTWFLEMKASFKILCEERTRWERKQDIKAKLKKENLIHDEQNKNYSVDDGKKKTMMRVNDKEIKNKINELDSSQERPDSISKKRIDNDETFSITSTTSSYIESQRVYTPLPGHLYESNRIPSIDILPECCSKKVNKSNGNIIFTKDRKKTEDIRLQKVMSNISTKKINIDERQIEKALGVKSKAVQSKEHSQKELSELGKDVRAGVFRVEVEKLKKEPNLKEKEVIPLTNNNRTTLIFPTTKMDDTSVKNIDYHPHERKKSNLDRNRIRPNFFNELCASSLGEVDYEKQISTVVEEALQGWTSKKSDAQKQKPQSSSRKKFATKLWNLQMGLTNSLHIPPNHRNSYVLSSPSNENPWEYQFHLLGMNTVDKSNGDMGKITPEGESDQNRVTTPIRINKASIQDFLKIRRESRISPFAKELKKTRDHLFEIRANAEEDEIVRRQDSMNEAKDTRQMVDLYKVDESSKAYSTTVFSSPRELPVKSPKPKELARLPITSVPIETMYLKHELNERAVSLTPRSEAFAVERKNLLLKAKPGFVKQYQDGKEFLKYHFLIPNSESIRHENQRQEVSKIMACFQKWVEKEEIKIAEEEKEEMDLLFNSDDDSVSVATPHTSDGVSIAAEVDTDTRTKSSTQVETPMSPLGLQRLRGARHSVFGRALIVPQSNPAVTCRLNFPDLGENLQDDPNGMGKRVLLTNSKKKGKGKKGKGKGKGKKKGK